MAFLHDAVDLPEALCSNLDEYLGRARRLLWSSETSYIALLKLLAELHKRPGLWCSTHPSWEALLNAEGLRTPARLRRFLAWAMKPLPAVESPDLKPTSESTTMTARDPQEARALAANLVQSIMSFSLLYGGRLSDEDLLFTAKTLVVGDSGAQAISRVKAKLAGAKSSSPKTKKTAATKKAPATKKTEVHTAPPKDRPVLREALRIVLGHKSMNRRQIYTALESRGWAPTGRTPLVTLTNILCTAQTKEGERVFLPVPGKKGFYRVRPSLRVAPQPKEAPPAKVPVTPPFDPKPPSKESPEVASSGSVPDQIRVVARAIATTTGKGRVTLTEIRERCIAESIDTSARQIWNALGKSKEFHREGVGIYRLV